MNILYSLPQNWCWATMIDVGNNRKNAIVDGPFGSNLKVADYVKDGEVPVLTISNIDQGFCRDNLRFISQDKFLTIQRSAVYPGDILMAKIGASYGKCGFYPSHMPVGIIPANMLKVSVSREIDKQYIFWFYKGEFFKNHLNLIVKSTAQPAFNVTSFKSLPIPLPPVNEQHRIVAKIEALTARSRKAREALDAIPTLLDQFRQSVLAAAFRGDLTADWRSQNPDVEPAEKLLERIRAERRARWEVTCQLAKENGIRKPKALKESSEAIELSRLPRIPESWSWERLVNISDLIGGVTKGRKLKGKKTIRALYLRVANVQDGYLDLTAMKEIEILPEDLDKYRLQYGDVLFTEGGDRDKLGRGTVWRNEIDECIHQNHVYRARLFGTDILPEYVSLAAKTEYSKDYFFRNASQTVNLASINMTTLGKLPLPVPSVLEQREICIKVQNAFDAIEGLRKIYQSLLEDLSQLDQSVLAKAFRGELVPQDPNDEPASVLLERIRAEREKVEKKGKGKRGRGKGKGKKGKSPKTTKSSGQLDLL